MVDGARNLVQGSPSHSSTHLGPQADAVQSSSISRFLEVGKKDGQVLVGGDPAKKIGANFIQPTVFVEVSDKSDINQQEIFGPVLVLHEFEEEDEVIQRANDTECKPLQVTSQL